MPGLDFSFRLVPAWDMDVNRWSYGTIERPQDLYSQETFGAMQDLRCHCGALSGQRVVGQVCTKCGVVVEVNARSSAQRRMARIVLAYDWKHLWTGETLRVLPILPWPFRVDDSHQPNALGRRYERLVDVNARLTLDHPASETLVDRLSSIRGSHRELDDALADLYQGSASGPVDGDCLWHLLQKSIRSADPETDIVLRACGFSFKIECAC